VNDKEQAQRKGPEQGSTEERGEQRVNRPVRNGNENPVQDADQARGATEKGKTLRPSPKEPVPQRISPLTKLTLKRTLEVYKEKRASCARRKRERLPNTITYVAKGQKRRKKNLSPERGEFSTS